MCNKINELENDSLKGLLSMICTTDELAEHTLCNICTVYPGILDFPLLPIASMWTSTTFNIEGPTKDERTYCAKQFEVKTNLSLPQWFLS